MVLDVHIEHPTASNEAPTTKPLEKEKSFIEIGFGDNRKSFAGLHRFEVSRDLRGNDSGNGEEGVEICYSSIYCNPTVDKKGFLEWLEKFHLVYAQCLFRDGVREVLAL